MPNSNNEILFFNSIIVIKKPILNEEFNFLKFFYEKINVLPLNIIIYKDFIFIFVNNEDYFTAKQQFRKLRFKFRFPKKKYLILRSESTLLRLIFSFFQDTYIHDIKIDKKLDEHLDMVKILFLFKRDKLIAIGNNGSYIKAVNYIFNNYFYNSNNNRLRKIFPIQIACDLVC